LFFFPRSGGQYRRRSKHSAAAKLPSPRFFAADAARPMLTNTRPKYRLPGAIAPHGETCDGSFRAASMHPLDVIRPCIDTGSKRFPFDSFKHWFQPLFKVLFIFRSRYLFAIGLAVIFSFRSNLRPGIKAAIPNNPTLGTRNVGPIVSGHERGSHPLWRLVPKDLCQRSSRCTLTRLQF